MKKLISAVTSLCMAATMVSAVVPATVGAADATKGFSIKTYNPDKPGISDGSSTVTVTKDQLANGDYTFPAAVYLTEDTNGGTGSFSLNLSTDSPDIKFDLKSPNQSYFDTEKTFTISSGEAETDCYISFGGKTSRLSGYEAAGRYVFGIAESQSKAGTDNYFLGLTWNNDGEKYKWAGTKSDDFPVYVFDITVPKGTPAGTYNVNFLHYDTDDRADVTVMTPLLEAAKDSDADPSVKYSLEDNNLKLNNLTIEVQGDAPVSVTTTTAVTTPVTTTTTTQVTPPVGNADFKFSIVDENGQSAITAKAGQKILVDVLVDAGSNTCAGMDAQFDLDGLTITEVAGKSAALGNAKVKDNKTEGRFSIIATDEVTGEPTAVKNGKSAITFEVEVPKDATNKTYTIGMVDSELKIFKQGGSGDKYTGAWSPLKITVGDPGPSTSTTTQVQPVTTTTTQVTPPIGNADFNFSIVDENGKNAATVKAGQKVLVDVLVDAGNNTCAGMDTQITLGDLTITEVSGKSAALGNAKVKDNKTEGRFSIIATDEVTGEPAAVKNGKSAITFEVQIPENAANGTEYTLDMVASELKIFKQGGSGDKYTGACTPLKLTVGDPITTSTTAQTTTTTTTTQTTTVSEVTTTAPITTTTVTPGTKLAPTWGDVNCDGSVNVADVVVLNRYLNNPTYPVSDQGKVNGDVLDPQDKTGAAVDPAGVRLTAADSETILKSIVELVTLPQ